jgi:hypothetical protein
MGGPVPQRSCNDHLAMQWEIVTDCDELSRSERGVRVEPSESAYRVGSVKVPGECRLRPGWVAPEGGIRYDRRAEPKTHLISQSSSPTYCRDALIVDREPPAPYCGPIPSLPSIF